jgi:hypothetical protein
MYIKNKIKIFLFSSFLFFNLICDDCWNFDSYYPPLSNGSEIRLKSILNMCEKDPNYEQFKKENYEKNLKILKEIKNLYLCFEKDNYSKTKENSNKKKEIHNQIIKYIREYDVALLLPYVNHYHKGKITIFDKIIGLEIDEKNKEEERINIINAFKKHVFFRQKFTYQSIYIDDSDLKKIATELTIKQFLYKKGQCEMKSQKPLDFFQCLEDNCII